MEYFESVNGDDPAPYRIDERINVVAWVETEANAAFIVQACNAHDELVAALQIIADATDEPSEAMRVRAADVARAALAKVQPTKPTPPKGLVLREGEYQRTPQQEQELEILGSRGEL